MSAPTCNYLMLVDGRQRECGAPATHTLNRLTRAGFRLYYCEPHAHAARTSKGKHDIRELRADELRREAAGPSTFALRPSTSHIP